MPGIFSKTLKQAEACKLMRDSKHTMLFGGSRSGKTFIIIRQIILRALKKTSSHLIVRHRFNHAKTSIVMDTFPDVMALCFPHVPHEYHSLDGYYSIRNIHGEESQIWIAGADSKDRSEKALGNEYSTIYLNEWQQEASGQSRAVQSG